MAALESAPGFRRGSLVVCHEVALPALCWASRFSEEKAEGVPKYFHKNCRFFIAVFRKRFCWCLVQKMKLYLLHVLVE